MYIFFKVNEKLGRMAEKLIDQLDCPNSYRYFWTGPDLYGPHPPIFEDSTIQISNVCDPNFLDSDNWNCTKNYEEGYCNTSVYTLLYYAVKYEHGYETVWNCPECGCDGTAKPLPPYDPNEARSDNHQGHK